MYTIKEAHAKLNCNRQTVNNWIKRLDIEVATIDGMYRLTEEQYNMIAYKVNANRTNQYTN
ncbi:helix-turn-helix domain-containing protein, partial [Staphylococcus epidermidis]|uniref:helix-turn-helix domain-containing protein n=1 Tax=Staphylococcus epidermidis TaxID=1282 RepID=UPI000D4432D3